jgi:ATP-binding cassette subfamily C protein CydC
MFSNKTSVKLKSKLSNSKLSNLHLIKRLLIIAKPHWQWLCVGVLLATITLLANIALLSVSGWFISAMAAAGIAGVSMNYFTPAGVIRFLAILRTAGRYGERLVTHNATLLVLSELRTWFFNRLEPLAPAGLSRYRNSDLLSRLQNDIEQLDQFYLTIALPCIVAVIAVPVIYFFSYQYYPLLAAVILISLLICALISPLWVSYKTRRAGSAIATQQQALSTSIIDSIQGMRELEIYGASAAQKSQFLHCSEQLSISESQINQVNAQSQSTQLAIASLTLFISLMLLALALDTQEIEKSHFVMLLLLTLVAFEAVAPLPFAFEQLHTTLSAARRLFSLADQEPVRAEPSNPFLLATEFDTKVEQNKLSIVVANLNFSYPYTNKQILEQLSFTLNPGEKIAITGPSGKGKSTIVQLLQGFYPSPANTIKIAGVDINQLCSDHLRSYIAIVSQHSYLFHATIRDNLLLANPHASEDQLISACNTANATEFINELPLGMDTWLGETGKGLSGGQARRIHIAQALLKDAPILILDEPTEGLDTITEQLVIEAIWQLMRDKTVLLITHNPHLLNKVDRCYVL